MSRTRSPDTLGSDADITPYLLPVDQAFLCVLAWPKPHSDRILRGMGQTAVIPAWVVPTARAVADCHWIAHACALEAGDGSYAQIVETMNWVMDGATPEAAYERMRARTGDPVGDTLTWLLGMGSRPPLRLPRRTADGTVVTAEQLADEYMVGKTGLPEQRLEARNRAGKDAALYRRLAALVPH